MRCSPTRRMCAKIGALTKTLEDRHGTVRHQISQHLFTANPPIHRHHALHFGNQTFGYWLSSCSCVRFLRNILINSKRLRPDVHQRTSPFLFIILTGSHRMSDTVLTRCLMIPDLRMITRENCRKSRLLTFPSFRCLVASAELLQAHLQTSWSKDMACSARGVLFVPVSSQYSLSFPDGLSVA